MIAIAALAATLVLSDAPLPPPGLVDGPTARRLVEAGVTVVDVRTPAEYVAGHLPGARLIPHDQIEARAAELGARERPVLLYCRTGRRTSLAKAALTRLGFTAVYDMQALERWTGPLVSGAAAR
jgi:rhodanese-related sulfurtransferase